ncbi:MAG: dethiobiotin synthase [Betaproteobacteria bacterium]|nr:dethiobiotin synthase [Betaproteobacteria bacterium]
MNNCFITGTDTGVGKTFATCALIAALQARGLDVAAMKPVAAGVAPGAGLAMNEDVAAYQDLTGHRHPLHLVNPYCFHDAIAPHIAAARQGVVPDLSVIHTAYNRLAERADVILVEGAGGFLVPLTEEASMADVPVRLHLDVILVVGMRLGCLNHALLTAEAIRARGLALAGWIANTPAPGEPMNAYDENLSTLRLRLGAPMLGALRFDPDPQGAAQRAAALLQLSPLLEP